MHKILSCPKCNREMKSTSGWTLHVKKCCPELRWMKTHVKMVVEFDIPEIIDMSMDPACIFRRAYGPYELGDCGCATLTAAALCEHSASPRPASQMELAAIRKSEATAEKTQAVAEYRHVLVEIIGQHKESRISTDAHRWPEEVTLHLVDAERHHRTRLYSSAIHATFKFLKDGTLVAGCNDATAGKLIVHLADPDCFEKVREFTGLRP